MSISLLITSIIVYILSLVISLMLMIVSKRINSIWRKRIIIFHLLLFIIYFLSLFLFKSSAGIIFMVFFCSGIAVAGIVLRSDSNIFLKFYYSLFLLSLLVFLYSPSLLLSLLSQQKIPERKGNEFLLKENYYLVKQQAMLNIMGNVANYKIILRTGKFNKTLKRDISFLHEIDSVKTLFFKKEKNILLRGYFTNENKTVDSMDITTDLKIRNENEILIKRK